MLAIEADGMMRSVTRCGRELKKVGMIDG